VALPGAGQTGFVIDPGVEFSRRCPERAQRPASAGVIPNARADHATGARYTRHLRQPGDRIVHEVDNQLGNGCVEGAVRERKAFRRRHLDGDAGQALSGCVDEPLRRGHGSNRGGAQPADEFGRERPRSAADVEDTLRTGYTGKRSHLGCEQN